MPGADLLIEARWIVPVEPSRQVLEDHAVALRGARIQALGPVEAMRARFPQARRLRLERHALLPGLVNAHTHLAMNLLRGYADDLPLQSWLTERIWPAETRWVSEEFVRDGTRLALTESLRGGVTCVNDMYFYPEVTGQVARQAGMRAVLGLIVLDFPTAYASGPEEYLAKAVAVHDAFRDDPLVGTAFAPHAPYTVSDRALERIATYQAELDIPIHMHVNETAAEVREHLQRHGERPLERLDRLGLLGPQFIAVHMVVAEAADRERLAARSAHVVHCPESNLKLGSGLCPVAEILGAGINVAIGTDGAASNNDLDLLGETRTAALLAKGLAGARALPAARALEMATLGGARALGLAEETGSLVPGKSADLIAVDLETPETLPCYDVLGQLVYAVSRRQVSDVWVAGRRLLEDRRLTTIDLDDTLERAVWWQQRIARETNT